MSSLVEIKKRISSISSTIKVTKVMQMIATAKIAKIKQMVGVANRYNNISNRIVEQYIKNTDDIDKIKKYTENRNKKFDNTIVLILFSSDKGTCGSINTNIFKEFTNVINEYQKKGFNISVLPIGKKACQFTKTNCSKMNFCIYNNTNIDAEWCDSEKIANTLSDIIHNYDNGKICKILAVYHRYKNIITCNAISEKLLPLDIKIDKSGLYTINDDTSYNNSTNIKENNDNFINVYDDDNTCSCIIECFLREKLYNIFVSNLASIVSSRMNAMDNATKNGQEIINELIVKYNKGRQANITSELSDIVSGFEAIS